MTTFERDTAVEPIAPGRFRARLDPRWRIVRGPNGGYLAAVLLRAVQAAIGDPERAPRSLTVHYVRRAEDDAVEIAVTEERSGRSLSTVTARMLQGERVIAVAVAALSQPRHLRDRLTLDHARVPDVIPLADAARWSSHAGSPASGFHRQFDIRWAIPETPRSGATVARSAAWVRLAEPPPLDAPLLALLADALPPAVFALRTEADIPVHVPTVDLTVHFRAPLPPGRVASDHLLLDFRTRVVADGFLEEDGEIWTPDGVLLAQSRQLAVLA